MNQYALGGDNARFSVVSFAENATTRVAWSSDESEINAGIDEMMANGETSISDGLEAAGQLFTDSRPGATKVLLLLSDGQQTVDAAPGKSLLRTAIDAATLVKGSGVAVFAWGFGRVRGFFMHGEASSQCLHDCLAGDTVLHTVNRKTRL